MDEPRTKAEVKPWAEWKLKRRLTDEDWQWLDERGFVGDAAMSEFGRKSLLDFASHMARGRRVRQKRGPRVEEVFASAMHSPATNPMLMRALVLSRHYGRAASREKFVQRLRDKLFAGKELWLKEASALLNSVAPCYLPYRFFASRGIPLVGHRSDIVDDNEARKGTRRSTSKKILRIQWSGNTLDIPDASRLLADARRRGAPFAALRGARKVIPGSVFDEIRLASKTLYEKFAWEATEATEFLLTGDPPIVRPLSFKFSSNFSKESPFYSIDLRIVPWIPAELVSKEYRDLQTRFYGERRNKQVGIKSLRLFGFVEMWREMKPKITWNELFEKWNAMVESRRRLMFDDYRHFRQQYDRAHRLVLFNHPTGKVRLAPPVADKRLEEFLAKADACGVLVRRS